MKLPELSEGASPEFVDAASCREWLEHVPLANVAAAQSDLLDQLEELNRAPISSSHRLAVLEALREAVHFVQIEQAKRFSNRALPLAEQETAAFTATIALWDEMALGYARCVEGAVSRDSGMKAQGALVCQRLLAYLGLKMFHRYRAYREIPAVEWRELHEAYAAAEKLDVAEEAVKDLMNRDVHDTSPRAQYARAVLMAMCNPNELSQRQLTFVAYLLERWASKLEVGMRPVAEDEGVPPLVADLAGDACPERTPAPNAREPRYLDSRKLAKSLRSRVALLRKGESPAKLALGEDCVQPSCEQLLVHLYRHWCLLKPARAAERRSGLGTAELCSELAGIHYYISGRVFRAPGGQTELTQKQREEIATFGRVSTREEDDYSNAQGYLIEHWEVEDLSAQGMRLARKKEESGRRFSHGQLVGVRPSDGKLFMLAQVRWLLGAENGELRAGLRFLPGMPSPLAVRPTGLNVQSDAWIPAISLGAVQAMNAAPTLVLPPGWYKPKRIIEVYADRSFKARLNEVLERGVDFERASYEVVP